MLTTEGKVKAHPEVVDTVLPNQDVVLLHLGTKQYYTLNETASVVWQLLGQGLTIREVGQNLEDAFDVTLEEAQLSVLELVAELVTERLAVPLLPGQDPRAR